MTYLSRIDIDETGLPVPSPELEQERRVAVFDLQEQNSFEVKGRPDGPYALRLGMEDRRAVFDWTAEDGETGRFTLSLGPISQSVKDYRDLCEVYAEAIRTLPPARISEIDGARREIHGEAARQLRDALSDHAVVDEPTARRLFTLVCAMTPA